MLVARVMVLACAMVGPSGRASGPEIGHRRGPRLLVEDNDNGGVVIGKHFGVFRSAAIIIMRCNTSLLLQSPLCTGRVILIEILNLACCQVCAFSLFEVRFSFLRCHFGGL